MPSIRQRVKALALGAANCSDAPSKVTPKTD